MTSETALNWNDNFNEILKKIQTTKAPFKVSGFFNNNDPFYLEADAFYNKYKDLKLNIMQFTQQEFIKKIKSGDFNPYSSNFVTIEEFLKLNQKKHLYKSYDNILPKEFVPYIQQKISPELFGQNLNETFKNFYYFRFFLGLKGDETEPHLDWSSNQNFLFQIFGTKEVFLISPEYFHKLPFISNYLEYSIDELIEYADQNNIPYTKYILNRGEGIFMPSYYLHAVKYLTDSSSLSLRVLPIGPFIQLHHLLPANKFLAQILWSIYTQGNFSDQIMTELTHIKNYDQALQIYSKALKEVCKIDEQDAVVPTSFADYEKHLFEIQRTPQYIMDRSLHKIHLIKNGAAYFGER